MKPLFFFLFLLTLLCFNYPAEAQLSKDAWGLGFGGVYPRFISVSGDGFSANTNFGAYLSLQRDFSEHISLRARTGGYHLESNYYTLGNVVNVQKVNVITGDIDLIYTIFPCEVLSPFLLAGGGFIGSKSENSFSKALENKFVAGYEVNLALGAYYDFSDDWQLKGEINYHTASHNKLDGNYSVNEQDKGIFGGNGDTYMTFELGVVWLFSKGEPSTICNEAPEGIREIIKHDTVEVPKEIIKIEKDTVYRIKPMLFNVNFDFDKSNIRVESYPILMHAIDVLKENPDMRIVISGHTDSFGSDEYNVKLSQRRVNSVYNFLTERGIEAGRISREAFGEKMPVKDNTSSINRAFNRRVEFRIVEGK
jgi:OOP family OmpA-OmpF porin